MFTRIFLVVLFIVLAIILSAGTRESHSAVSASGTINTLLPNPVSNVFPSDGVLDMPRNVTLVWHYNNTASRSVTGFRVYRNGSQVGNVIGTSSGFYTYALTNITYDSNVEWKVIPYNAAGEHSTAVTWDFTLMSEPTNPDHTPASIVFMTMPDFTGNNPAPITLPAIDLGEGLLQPTADFLYTSGVSDFDINVQFTDQPYHPVTNPENVGASFGIEFPNGVPTDALISFSGTRISDQLQHWNGSQWVDVPGATFGPGWVNFTWTSTSRGFDIFVINTGTDNPLPVTLSSFAAIVTPTKEVKLDWVTQSESNILGYFLLRNESDHVNTAIRINNNIIEAYNSSSTRQYSHTDSDVAVNHQYYYWLTGIGADGTITYFGPLSVLVEPDDHDVTPPETGTFGIQGIYPNPFNPSTTLSFGLQKESEVSICIYNILGELVREYHYGTLQPGNDHNLRWDGKDRTGQSVGSGIYFFRLNAGIMHETRKAMLLK